MLRTPIAALTAALILTAFSSHASQAADPHWFYDNAAAPSYDERYSEDGAGVTKTALLHYRRTDTDAGCHRPQGQGRRESQLYRP